MDRTLKVWIGLGVAAGIAVTGPSMAADRSLDKPEDLLLADNSGSEGEGAEPVGVATGNDAAYLATLGLLQGHLHVGTALYKMGETEMAKSHMKHPRDEIYTDLEPIMVARKAPGFAAEMDALSTASAEGAPAEKIDALLAAFNAAVARNRPATAPLVASAVVQMVRAAADEYALGVREGKITELHEYQDAWGFVQVAQQLVADLSADERAEHQADITAIEAQLAGVQSLWPDIAGKKPLTGGPDMLYAAAARIELSALNIK